MKFLWFEKGAYASNTAKRYLTQEFNPLEIKQIAVMRHAALGDQVLVRPFLIEARKFFPNAKITLVGVANYQYGIPSELADETVIAADRQQAQSMSLFEKISDYQKLPKQDIIFDLAGTSRSYWMTFFTKAQLKIGFPYTGALRGSLYNITVHRSDFEPEVECMLDMLKILGHAPSYPLDFAYPDHRIVQEKNEPFILYFSGASTENKAISRADMKETMIEAQSSLPDYRHIYLEGVKDWEKGDFLNSEVNKGLVEVQECLPLEQVIQLIAESSLLISPDTGIRNVAISTHTPTVGVFYTTVPFRYTPQYELHHIVMNASGEPPKPSQIADKIYYHFSSHSTLDTQS